MAGNATNHKGKAIPWTTSAIKRSKTEITLAHGVLEYLNRTKDKKNEAM